jgi:nicotinate dehydrogenase subunit A
MLRRVYDKIDFAMTEIEVNGARHEVECAADTPLLYVLRNELGLLGSRFGCGSGQCGACFVLVDGRAMASCDLPLSFVSGKKVTTVEGLKGEHPVQKALERHQAAQCGYCMSGIVMSAVALLSSSKNPTETEVRSALDKNLCRCGSHNRVVRAILDAR